MTLEKLSEYIHSKAEVIDFLAHHKFPRGRPGSKDKNLREFRIHHKDKSERIDVSIVCDKLNSLFLDDALAIYSLKFNHLSPNSSKFSSFTFEKYGIKTDLIITTGFNKGERFEKEIFKSLKEFKENSLKKSHDVDILIEKMHKENLSFHWNNVVEILQRSGSAQKSGIEISKLCSVIADIILIDIYSKRWYISIKDVNGDTFSSYSGGSSVFSKDGSLCICSDGSKFLSSFGADLNEVQRGFDQRNNILEKRDFIQIKQQNTDEIEKIFNRAWGYDYFYARKKVKNDWDVFWISEQKMNNMSKNIIVDEIYYPNQNSKQIKIKCHNEVKKYSIEIRNSKGGEYPCDIKIKTI